MTPRRWAHPVGSVVYVFGRHEFLVEEVFVSGESTVYLGVLEGRYRASVVGEHVTRRRETPA